MEDERLVRLTQALQQMATRRAAWRAVRLSGIVAMLTALPTTTASARKRRRRRRRCPKCDGRCLPTGFTCCPPETGGGSCSAEIPVCCPPSAAFPEGRCIARGQVCCGELNCFASQTCCPPSPGAPSGACVSAGSSCPV